MLGISGGYLQVWFQSLTPGLQFQALTSGPLSCWCSQISPVFKTHVYICAYCAFWPRKKTQV